MYGSDHFNRTTPEIKDGNKKIKKTFEFDRHEDSFIDIFQPSNINKKKKEIQMN